MIPFNKPFLTGKELAYIRDAVEEKKLSGNGKYTQLCQKFFEERYGFKKCLLTTSCTDALEMAALLIDIQPGDEVIVPSYTFVSTANAFILRGAKIVFADSGENHPNLDVHLLESLITPRTKAIVPVHYAGVGVDMDVVMRLAEKHNLFVVEDAAQAIDSFYKGRPLGSVGHLAAFSFHETKNIISGEGGMLVINDDRFLKRAEIIWEKGTNRSAFWRGEIDKYGWVDIGSSFLPSEIVAAFLYAQLENLQRIQSKRKWIWHTYYSLLEPISMKGYFSMPPPGDEHGNNGHMFYICCRDLAERDNLILFLKSKEINAVFHYLSLHRSQYYQAKHDGRSLPNADRFSDCLLRLPLFYDLEIDELKIVANCIDEFYKLMD